MFVCTVSKKNRSACCVGHQSLPHIRQRCAGTVVTNGSAFALIAPTRERLLHPLWLYAATVTLWQFAFCIVGTELMAGLSALARCV